MESLLLSLLHRLGQTTQKEALLLPKACPPSSQLRPWGGRAMCPASFGRMEGSVLDRGLIQNSPYPGSFAVLLERWGLVLGTSGGLEEFQGAR